LKSFEPLLSLLATIPDPRRAEGKLYQLRHVLLFSIFAMISGANSYRSLRTYFRVHRQKLNEAFEINWKSAPAHTAIGYILHRLSATEVERVFREHAANLNCAPASANARVVAFDGKTLKGSFDSFNDIRARQVLSAFAVDTGLVLAHIEIDKKSNKIPAMQKLLQELGLAGHIATADADPLSKKLLRPPASPMHI
jgi:DDE_Tnp_1-associated